MARVFDNEELLFLKRWLKSPLRTGAVWPSGADLARLMAAGVDPDSDGLVVELGGGTGAVTEAILATGLKPAQLVVIESDAKLHAWLVDRFPQTTVLHGRAEELARLLAQRGLPAPETIVSSLPLLSMPPGVRRQILNEVFRVLAPGGSFVQFTYAPTSPLSDALVEEFRVTPRLEGVAWRNLPPATVWRFERRPAPGADA